MPSYTGHVRHNDLEGGFWELHTERGEVFRLEGDGPWREGARVQVRGSVEAAGFGIHMTGARVLVVDQATAVS
jgi:hypothetical protein